jgi:hypothetical protein
MKMIQQIALCCFLLNCAVFLTTQQALAHEGEHESHSKKSATGDFVPIAVSFKVNWWLPSNSTVDQFYGGFGNEIYSLHLGFPINLSNNVLEPFVEPGILFEKSSLIGANSARKSGDKSKLLLIPIRFGLGYTFIPDSWFIVPTVDAAYTLTFFDLKEDNVSVDGNKHLLSVRGGIRILLDRTVKEADWKEFFGFRSAFFALIAGQDINLIGTGLKLDGFVFGPELGIVF